MTLALFVVMRRWEKRDQQEMLNFASSHFVEAIRRASERIELAHKFVRQDFYGSTEVSRREFDLCAEPILQYVPSLQVLQWAPRVELAHRESFEQSARRQGWADYRIVEPNARGQLVPAGHRDVSFPIWYAATRSGFQARFGWDFMADPALREAIERCRDTNQFVVSRQIDLSQSGLPSRVLQTFLPVYRDHEHTKSIADRRKNLEGLLVGLCEVDDLIDGALRYASGPQGLDVAIFDLASGDSPELLYFHVSRTRDGDIRSATATPNPPGLHFDGSLQFGGRPWQLVCTPAPKFFAAHASWRSWTALVVGLIVTGSVANRAWTWMTRTQRVERLVTERTLDLRKKDDQLRQVQENKARAIRHAHEETIQRLMAASLCRDEETGQHIRRTGLLSEMLARAAGWSDADAELIRLAAPMHDIGKIGIPDAILRKPDKLTPAEYETMKMHTLLGARMLEGSQSAILALAHDIALAHHERWDGRGYPQGLAGQAIPEAARIVSIVDVFDAVSHNRVYRLAMPEDEVLKLLSQGAGTQFDPALVALFLMHFDQARRIIQENPDETALPPLSTAPTDATPAPVF